MYIGLVLEITSITPYSLVFGFWKKTVQRDHRFLAHVLMLYQNTMKSSTLHKLDHILFCCSYAKGHVHSFRVILAWKLKGKNGVSSPSPPKSLHSSSLHPFPYPHIDRSLMHWAVFFLNTKHHGSNRSCFFYILNNFKCGKIIIGDQKAFN